VPVWAKPKPPRELLEKRYRDPNMSIKDLARDFDVSKRTVHRWLDHYKIERRKPPTIITQELKQQIIIDYIRFIGITALEKKYRMHGSRIRRILKDAGIHTLSSSKMTRAKMHLTGKHWVPISRDLAEVFDGELLGDGSLFCKQDKVGVKWREPLLNYVNALDMLHLLRSLDKLDFTIAVEEFNEGNEIISDSQTSYFDLHKSIEEKAWVCFLGQLLKSHGHSVSISDTNRTIRLYTQGTVQICKLYQRWYKNGKKIVPSNLKLTPRVVLHWFIGDGGTGKYRVALHTLAFSKEENELLADLLNKEIGISATLISKKSRKQPDKVYYRLDITGHRNYRGFLDYLELAPDNSLNLAKQLFPWKFSTDIRKKDVIADRILLSAKKRFNT
jgi:hypothetical protein